MSPLQCLAQDTLAPASFIKAVHLFIQGMAEEQRRASSPSCLHLLAQTSDLASQLQEKDSIISDLQQQLQDKGVSDSNAEPTDNPSEAQLVQFSNWLQKSWESSQTDDTPAPPKDPFQSAMSKLLESDTVTEKPQDGTADPILQPCNEALRAWFRRINPGNQISEVLKECLRPSNCEVLKPVVINDEVLKLMSPQDKVNDQRMKWLENGIVKAASPLATAWNQLLLLEFTIRSRTCDMNQTQDPEVEFTPPDAMIPLNKDNDMNLSEIIRHLKLSLKMLGYCRVQAVQKRCLDLKDVLSGQAKELAEPHQPFDDKLFGPDLNKHFNNILAMNKVSLKIAGKPRGEEVATIILF